MNIERLKLIRHLFADVLTDEQVDMASYGDIEEMAGPTCGTAGCIAGWTVARMASNVDFSALDRSTWPETVARKYLDLTEEQGFYLFCGYADPRVVAGLTRKDVVAALDGMIETGRPNWPPEVETALARAWVWFGKPA